MDFEYYSSYGPECGAAFEDYAACLSELDCMAFARFQPCLEQKTLLDQACLP